MSRLFQDSNVIRVALVHDWLTGMRGGESVLEALAELFPKSELFTLLYVPGKIAPELTILKRHTSWLQKVPQAESRYRYFLPWMPSMIESFDLSEFDLVISSSHCVAKGVKKSPSAVHVSYIHAPMRYMWDRYDEYFGPGQARPLVRWTARWMRPRLQKWDRQVSSPERIDTLISNSHFIAQQVKKAYQRDSQVVFPFANLSRFSAPRKPSGTYLMVTAFAPYKRIDIAIEAFNRLKLPLIIVGTGQDEKKLKAAAGATITFLGSLSNAAIADLYAKCKAFIFPGVEDFGITPLEAMAAGAPVIAYQGGGAAETVTEATGLFFGSQTPEALMEAILKIENQSIQIDEKLCRSRAAEFSKDRFQREFLDTVRNTWKNSGKKVDLFDEQFSAPK